MNLTGKSLPELQNGLARLQTMTVPRLLAERVEAEPGTVALRYKRGGVFRELTWRSYRDEIRTVAAGLLESGLTPGARIAIMGDVCLEYLLADMAAMLIGAIPCGVYPTSSPEEVRHVLGLVEARIFVAEDQEHLDRLLATEELHGGTIVDTIIVCDERALFLYDDPRIRRFNELVE